MYGNYKKIITLPLYTETAKNIVNVAIMHWSQSHQRTWLAHKTVADFDKKIAPDGSLVIFNCDYYRSDRIKTEMVAWAIGEFLKQGTLYRKSTNAESDEINYKNSTIIGVRTAENNPIILDKSKNMVLRAEVFAIDIDGWSKTPSRSYVRDFIEFNSQDAWIIYDYILGHRKSTMEKQFGIQTIDKVIGAPNNPMIVEQIKFLNDQVNEISNKSQAECDTLNKEMNAKINQIRREYEDKIAVRKNQATEEIAKLNAEFEELKKMADLMSTSTEAAN